MSAPTKPPDTVADALRALRLMHYQAEPITLDRSRQYVQPDKRAMYTKPQGFWVSVDGEHGWAEWCREEEFRTDTLTYAHTVRLAEAANIRLVTSVAEIDAFHEEFAAPTDFDRRLGWGVDRWGIEWAAVARRYDGIIITPYLWDRRFDGNTGWYYTWDCASGCIWNLDAIESVSLVSEVAA
ncbi:hypothetical protein [Nocardia nova]